MCKKINLLFFILLLCGLSGCSRAAAAPEQGQHRMTDISSAEAEILSMTGSMQETETLMGDRIILTDEEIFARHAESVPPGSYASLDTVIRNRDRIFFQISYSEEMAQYTYRNQLYVRSLGKDEDTLLYDTSDAYCLNGICANDMYLYWVEYVSSPKSDGAGVSVSFKVMQCQLDNGNISCIAERNGDDYYDMSLQVSDRFLTWYDVHIQDPEPTVELVVFDIEKQRFQERTAVEGDIQGLTVALYNSYMGITENGITYFMKDDREQLYIRRENLDTGATDTILLGETKPYDKIAACFSDSRYIGWYNDYGDRGDYYFYDTDSEKLYLWNAKKDGMYIFSNYFCGGKLYFNNTANHYVYVWDLPTGQVRCQNFGEDAYWIRSYGDGNLLYLGTSSIDTAGCCALHGGD